MLLPFEHITITAQTVASRTCAVTSIQSSAHVASHAAESLSHSRALDSQFWHLSEEVGVKVEKEDM